MTVLRFVLVLFAACSTVNGPTSVDAGGELDSAKPAPMADAALGLTQDASPPATGREPAEPEWPCARCPHQQR